MRKTTRFTGGDVPRHYNDPMGRWVYVSAQAVTVVKQMPGEAVDEYQVRTADGSTYFVDGCDLSPHPHEPELNTEFVVRLMEYGNPLVQGFVIEAVEKYSRQVLTMSDEERASMDAGFLPYEAWRQCAQQCLGLIVARDEERRERNKELTPAG